jgi:hypothetical protein
MTTDVPHDTDLLAPDDETGTVQGTYDRIQDLRRQLSESSASDQRIWSVDGATFQFDLVTEDPVPVGGYVELVLADGTRLLGQATDQAPGARPGPTLRLDVGQLGVGLGPGATAEVQLPVRSVVGSGPILGTIEDDDGRVTIGRPPRRAFHDATLSPADTSAVMAAVSGGVGDGGLAFATLLADPDVPVTLSAKAFGRHTFVCGQSGSGKTYSLGKLLEQLLLHTSLPILALDPNSDYVTITDVRPREETGLDEDAYAEQSRRIGELAPEVPVFGSGDDRVAVVFGRLHAGVQALALGLDPAVDVDAVGALRRATDEAGEDASLHDVLARLDGDEVGAQLATRVRNLGTADWGIWARDGEPTIGRRLRDQPWRAAVVDLGSLASADERSVVSAGVLGALWRRRYDRRPVLVVIDEAHNVCPAEPTSASQAAAADLVRAIAAEGRKFGLYLLLSTQEPHKVHPDVLSQCANLFLMRTTSRAALDTLASVFSDVPAGLLDLAPSFGLGQGVVAGRLAPHPLAFKTSARLTRDGGRDVPADWASGAA